MDCREFRTYNKDYHDGFYQFGNEIDIPQITGDEIRRTCMQSQKEDAQFQIELLLSKMQKRVHPAIKESWESQLASFIDLIERIDIKLNKSQPKETKEVPKKEVKPFEFTIGSASEMESLPQVDQNQLTTFWNQWNLIETEYNEKDFFINELGSLIKNFFSSARAHPENDKMIGIDLRALKEISIHVRDPINLHPMQNPYRLGCGHRISKESLDYNKNKCTYPCNVIAAATVDTLLDQLIKQLKPIKKAAQFNAGVKNPAQLDSKVFAIRMYF